MEQVNAFQNHLKKDAGVCVDVLHSEDQGLEFTCEGGLLLVGEDLLCGPQKFESLQKLRLGFEVRVGFRVTFYVRVRAKCLSQCQVSNPGAKTNP